jgi:hypothetical protein
MVDVAVMSIVGVIAGVFSDVETRVGVSVGEEKPGADEVFVAGRVEVCVGFPDGTCVAVGVFVLAGTGVSDGGGTGVDVEGGAITVKDPFDKVNVTPAPLGSEAAALLRENAEVPGDALGRTFIFTYATIPSGITSWLRPAMITLMGILSNDPVETPLLAEAAAGPVVTLMTSKRLLS